MISVSRCGESWRTLGRLFASSLYPTTSRSEERALTAVPQRYFDLLLFVCSAAASSKGATLGRGHPQNRLARSRAEVPRAICGKPTSHTQRPTSERQVRCDCWPAYREECALEQDGDPAVWFKPVDCEEEHCSAEADPGNIKKVYRTCHPRKAYHIRPRCIRERSGSLQHLILLMGSVLRAQRAGQAISALPLEAGASQRYSQVDGRAQRSVDQRDPQGVSRRRH
jgi:hypothetical protein